MRSKETFGFLGVPSPWDLEKDFYISSMSKELLAKYIPYARHYKSRFVYFFTSFPKTIYVLWPLALCMACIQERLLIKSGLWWRAYGNWFDWFILFLRMWVMTLCMSQGQSLSLLPWIESLNWLWAFCLLPANLVQSISKQLSSPLLCSIVSWEHLLTTKPTLVRQFAGKIISAF